MFLNHAITSQARSKDYELATSAVSTTYDANKNAWSFTSATACSINNIFGGGIMRDVYFSLKNVGSNTIPTGTLGIMAGFEAYVTTYVYNSASPNLYELQLHLQYSSFQVNTYNYTPDYLFGSSNGTQKRMLSVANDFGAPDSEFITAWNNSTYAVGLTFRIVLANTFNYDTFGLSSMKLAASY